MMLELIPHLTMLYDKINFDQCLLRKSNSEYDYDNKKFTPLEFAYEHFLEIPGNPGYMLQFAEK